jgi:hypothetical protein
MARTKADWPNPWLTLGQAAILAAEAQSVIALRLARLARGGRPAQIEAARMIVEKGIAFATAQVAAAAVLPLGGAPLAVDTVITTYRRAVRANRRRLSRSRDR